MGLHKGLDREEGTTSGDFLQPEPPSEGPSAGTGDEEGGTGPKSHRLQRQKHQSRKTFRFRRSRKGDREVLLDWDWDLLVPKILTVISLEI